MGETYKYKFRIDVYLKGDYQGSNYLETEVGEDMVSVMMSESPIKELTPDEILYMEDILPALYADVYEKAVIQEAEVCRKREYPYEADPEFTHYRFRIFM